MPGMQGRAGQGGIDRPLDSIAGQAAVGFLFFFLSIKIFPKCLMVQKAEEFSPAIGHAISV